MIIQEAVFTQSSSSIIQCPKDNRPEFAFIGRSNVGKSSLINMLTNRKKLAKTSSTPGKTQLINHFLINNKFYFVDLPGYGWAKVSKTKKIEWKKMLDNYLLRRKKLYNVFVLLDLRLKPQPKDYEFIYWLGSNGVPLSIVFTKFDKQTNSKSQHMKKLHIELLKKTWEELPSIFITSALKGTGKGEILSFIQTALQQSP